MAAWLLPGTIEQYEDHGPSTPRTVKSIVLLATTCDTTASAKTATIYERATVDDSGDFVFRIDVTDAAWEARPTATGSL
jgi:hypothetical protein